MNYIFDCIVINHDALYIITRPLLFTVYVVLAFMYIHMHLCTRKRIRSGENGTYRALSKHFLAGAIIFIIISFLSVIAYFKFDNTAMHPYTLLIIGCAGVYMIYTLYIVQKSLEIEKIIISQEDK